MQKNGILSSQIGQTFSPNLKIFKNAETFMRIFDIFKKKYEERTGKTIKLDISFELKHSALDAFCLEYVKQYPELITMNSLQRDKFVRLLSVFNIANDIVEMMTTLTASVAEKDVNMSVRSFKPIALNLESNQIGSNEISLGQKNLDKQIQNLNGSELAMSYIKDADGAAQFKALNSILGRKEINFVDLGGGRGETNALIKAIQDSGTCIHLLNIEPHQPFAKPYIDAHKVIGVNDVEVWQQSAQQCSTSEIIKHFNNQKVDVLFASHSLYFILGDMHKIAEEYTKEKGVISIKGHPLWKYFEMLSDKGVFVITLQSGAGVRLYRNAILGKHGLDQCASDIEDETVPLLSSFGNMATFLRHLELFAEHYKRETGRKIKIKMHYAIANVPLGTFEIKPHIKTKGYSINTPHDNILASKMLDFYGNWNELQSMTALLPEQIKDLAHEEQKRLGFENTSLDNIISKQNTACQMQETFLQILRVFAPALKNMQHPNIVLEITVN